MVPFVVLYVLMMKRLEEKLPNSFIDKSLNTLRLGKAEFMITNGLDYRRGVSKAVEDFCSVAVIFDDQKGLKAFLEKRKLNLK